MCDGVRQMAGVSSFVIRGNLWHTHQSETISRSALFSGPPSIRNWDLLHARPLDLTNLEPADISFQEALFALRVMKPIKSFSVYEEMVSQVRSDCFPFHW